MYPTVEVRWFQPGVVPPDVWKWYHQWESGAQDQPPRVDYYLRIEEGDSLGLKLREGQIEAKQRYSQPAVLRFGERSVGTVERWRKWSFPLAGTETGQAALVAGSSDWIAVKKDRSLRSLRMIETGRVEVIPLGEALDLGCGWEIALISVEGTLENWWSVGFEAFGEPAELFEVLLGIASHVLAQTDAPVFKIGDSYSYPKWLKRIAGA